MKKLTQNLRCLFLCLLAGMGSVAWAQTTTTWSAPNKTGDITSSYTNSRPNYTITFNKNNGDQPKIDKVTSTRYAVMSLGNTLTISSTDFITNISFTFYGSYNNISVLSYRSSEFDLSTKVWNGFSKKVTFKSTGLANIREISITYATSSQISGINPIDKIYEVADLVTLHDQINGGVDYSSVQQVLLCADLTVSDWDDPIGTAQNPFTHPFEGQSHSINLSGSTGLFGEIDGATIQNLTLNANIKNETYVNGYTSADYLVSTGSPEDLSQGFGGIANIANNSTFTNCNVQGTIEYPNQNNVGGVVGHVKGSGTITTCDVSAKLNGHRMTGGVVGGIYGNGAVTITDCSATYQVYGNSCTGGIVGNSENTAGITIQKCFNKAQVGENNSIKGGIIAHMKKGTITSCYNANTVSSGGENIHYVGGIAGYVEEGTISYCYNSSNGDVTGQNDSGDIVGKAINTLIQNVYNVGSVSGDVNVDPIAGSIDDNSSCTNVFYLSTTRTSSITGCTDLASSGMQGWELYSGNNNNTNQIGYGRGVDSQERKWVFVNQNYPLLYDVRGQEVSFLGHNCQHFLVNATAQSYTSFSSDVLFTTIGTNAYWVQRNGNNGVLFDHYSTTTGRSMTLLATHKTLALYPFDKDEVTPHQLGYLLESDMNTKAKLLYLPEGFVSTKVESYNPVSQSYSNIDGVTRGVVHTAQPEEMTADIVRQGNALYGIDVPTAKDNIIQNNDCSTIYVFGYRDKTGSEAYDTAIFAKYSGSTLAANKGYIPMNSSQASQIETTGIKALSIFTPVVEPTPVLLGDVDVDGAVTITDVVKMVNIVLNETADDVIMQYGDVNGDGDLDVADVVAIVNKVLGVENDVKSRKVNSAANGGDEASLELNDGVVDFLLNNSSAFCAFQFYMNAEDGLDCEKIILSARAKGHFLSMNQLTDGRYKVMCYSGVNKSFDGSEGELFNILTSGASGKLTLEDLFFVTPGASKVKFGNMDIDVVPTSISGIDADANANAIYDLSGRRVQKAQKGVYIVNGKKVIL